MIIMRMMSDVEIFRFGYQHCIGRVRCPWGWGLGTTHNASAVHVLQGQNDLSYHEARDGQCEIATVLAADAVQKVAAGSEPATHAA